MRAVASGRDAARSGQPITTCPHPRNSLLRSAWVRGYATAWPMAGHPTGDAPPTVRAAP
ncbi:Rmf/CrpP fold protein [Kitasatospora sp. NPDC057518]|uniref:Rmf/CrpP fold protein n=1 Tax=Kitasatospora sp. NPDC057518 TaxID=3346155 RepID=UPI003696A5A2